MSNFIKVNSAYINLDLVKQVYLEAVPKKHYADEPNYGSLIFKPGEAIYIRDEESLTRVMDALGVVDTHDVNKLLIEALGASCD